MIQNLLSLVINLALAQNFCPSLESIAFKAHACVPTREEICHSGQPGNCEVQNMVQKCVYIRGAGTQLYQNPEAARGFACVARGPDVCSGTPENPTCVPGPCVSFSPPACRSDCKPCHLENIEESQGIRGCKKFCGEESCQDEPRCDPDPCRPGQPCNQNNTCERKRIPGTGPLGDFILPQNAKDKCEPNQPCPTDPVAVPPEFQGLTCTCGGSPCEFTADGRVKPCVSGPTTCTPEPIREDTSQIQNLSCPWIEYERRQPTCAPVAVGNRFPQDCCECRARGSTAACKSCNIPTSRCQ